MLASENDIELSSEALWTKLRFEAREAARDEPALSTYLDAAILNQPDLASALAFHLAEKLSDRRMTALQVQEIFQQAYDDEPAIVQAAERDMSAVLSRDPACYQLLQPFLFFKGFAALQAYRIAHWLWRSQREILAYHFQSSVSELFQVDIHPATRIGSGVMFDHSTGITMGETAVVGDDCSILQGVTLGGTGKETGDRHPKIGNGVLVSVGAKVLGNITVGDDAKIAAGSVVLKNVEPLCTVAGVPAVPVGGPCAEAARNMDQSLPE
jgi:serine O-acetyltransferase